jgi:hypothetical protein
VLLEANCGDSSHTSAPENKAGKVFLLLQEVNHSLHVKVLVVAQRDILTLGMSTASEIETDK